MSKLDSLKRQVFIVGFLRKRPANFDEIDAYLLEKEQDTDFSLIISQRTFQRDRKVY